jgi:hypothetical protein
VVEVPDVRATLHRRNERRARERVVIAGARSEQKVLELQEKMLYAEANLAYHCPTVMGFMPANTENAVSPLLLRARAQLGRIPNV